MAILNFGFGRTFFFAKGTKEIKVLTNKPDETGCYMAKISCLATGTNTLRPVKFASKPDGRGYFISPWAGVPLEIH